MTSIIQDTVQPQYTHVSRMTLRRDCINMWEMAKNEMTLGFQSLETGVTLTCHVRTALHDSPNSFPQSQNVGNDEAYDCL